MNSYIKPLKLSPSFPRHRVAAGREIILADTEWKWWWCPEQSPLLELEEPDDWRDMKSGRPRLRYAPWLKDVAVPGVYLWLLPRPGVEGPGGEYRFVHVGMSTVSVRSRIEEHCRNQFRCGRNRNQYCTYDRIHDGLVHYGGDGFGVLGKTLWNGNSDEHALEQDASKRAEAAKAFLKSARIVVLSPIDTAGDSDGASRAKVLIKAFEAMVGSAAHRLLQVSDEDDVQTTNSQTLDMKNRCPPGEEQHVAKDLNRIMEMLPETPRMSPRIR